MIKVEIHLLSQSKPIKRNAINIYIKNGMYCVQLKKEVEKYPLVNIFRTKEK